MKEIYRLKSRKNFLQITSCEHTSSESISKTNNKLQHIGGSMDQCVLASRSTELATSLLYKRL